MNKIIIAYDRDSKLSAEMLIDNSMNYEKVLMPDREVIKIFGSGEISKLCRNKIGEYKLEMRDVDSELLIIQRKKANEFDKDVLSFYKLKIQLIEMKKTDIQKKIDKWQKVKDKLHIKKSVKENMEEFNMEAIKQIPIEDIIDDEPTYQSSTRAKYRCPIHEERTASFVVYRDSNTWYCFGSCASGGDNIKLYQLIHNCDFITACNELSKMLN